MLMTEQEIRTSYREAKKQKRQIKILAQLNCCSQEYIKKILNRGQGYEGIHGSN